MTSQRPFRFGVQGRDAASREEWVAKARKAEALGYATFLVADHFVRCLGPVSALAAAAMVTDRLRLGGFVFANDYRHPADLAKEAATLDLLSAGRLELGIGAGWLRSEYEAAGISFDPPRVRIGRLEEGVRVLKGLLAEEQFSFSGDHYTLADLAVVPKPVQRPHPPILIGGGGRRLLSVAARHADIVGFGAKSRSDGTLDASDITAAATARKVGWVREAAGERFDALELNIFVYAVEITADRRAAAERLAPKFPLGVDDVLATPHALLGTEEEIVDQLRQRRAEYGISYIVVADDLIDALAPIVARLAGI